MENLPVLEAQYRTLAGAVDATRHQMAVRGVYLPETGAAEEQYMGECSTEPVLNWALYGAVRFVL